MGHVSTKAMDITEDRSRIHAELPRQPPLDRCYREPLRAEILDFLLHLGPYTNDVLFVLGTKGSGKTTLIRQFLARVADSWRVAYVSAERYSSPDDVAHAASEAWGAQHEIAASNGMMSDVGKSAGDARGRGHRPILVIDEAQHLSDATLNWLAQGCETAQRDKNALGLVICGEPELLLSAATARLRKLPHHTFELSPLDYRQTTALVAQQCEVLGFPASMFSPAETAAVFQKAKGNLGRTVELIADKLQAHVADAMGATISARPPSESPIGLQVDDLRPVPTTSDDSSSAAPAMRLSWRWFAAASVGALLAAALWFQRDINVWIMAQQPAVPTTEHARAAPTVDTPAVTAAPVAPVEEPALAESVPTVDDAPPSAALPQPAALGPEEDLSAAITPSAVASDGPAAAAPPASLAPAAVADQAVATAPSVAAEKPAKLAPAAKVAPAKVVSPVAAAPIGQTMAGVRGPEWLAAQASTSYTLQLMAINKEQALRKVLKNVPNTSEMAVYRFRRGEGFLYGLVFGLYPTYEAAQAARAQIPKAVGPVQPWIRRLAIIHDEIRRADAAEPAATAVPTADVQPTVEAAAPAAGTESVTTVEAAAASTAESTAATPTSAGDNPAATPPSADLAPAVQ